MYGISLILWDEAGDEIDCTDTFRSSMGTLVASGLTPGGLYTFQIDGVNSNFCDYVLTVTGINSGSLPDPPGPIKMTPDTTLCPGAEVCFEIDPVNNANRFEWTLPANIEVTSGGGAKDLFVCGIIESAGGGAVTVTPSSYCFNGVPAIFPFVATPVPASVWPPIFVCNSDMPWDTTILGQRYIVEQYGGHQIVASTALGCDSIINFSLIPKIQIPSLIDTTICAGDCILVGGDCYDNAGTTTLVLSNPNYTQQNGCDSTVTLVINKIEPIASIAIPDPCATGNIILDGTRSSSGSNVTYSWSTFGGGNILSGSNSNTVTVDGLGFYVLSVVETSLNGAIACVASDTIEVTQQSQIINDPVFNQAVTNACLNEAYTYSIMSVPGAIDYVWTVPPGTTISGGGTSINVYFASLAGGSICVKAVGLCGESINICIPVRVNQVPTAEFTVTTPICITDYSTIQYTGTSSPFANFNWNFNGGQPATVIGPGPHNISWNSPGSKTVSLTVEESGCVSNQFSQTVQVDPELATPVISCDATPTSITFNWGPIAGAFDYTVTINGVPTRQPGTSSAVTGLNAGDVVTITVVANSNSACPSTMATQTCTAQGCPPVTIDISPVAPICRDASTSAINLAATQSGGVGAGIFTFSGNGVTNNGIFDPQMAAIGTNLITVEYVEGICSYTTSIHIEVYEKPTSTFDATTIICQTDLAMFGYSGTATNNANFNWDFGSGTIVSGSNSGPYEVAFANAGVKTVSLEVEENGCVSNISTQTIEVQEQLIPSIIRCSSTVNSVMFNWDLIPNATTYQIDIITGQSSVIDLVSRNVLVNGLNPGEVVEIEVIALSSNICGNITMSGSCIAQDCPMVSVDVEPVNDICLTASTQPIQLSATAANNSGTFTFSGNGVTNSGVFDPQMAGIGMNRITVEYVDGSCSYSGSTTILINETPTATFDVTTPICQSEMATISYTGTATNNANFNWDFGGGNIATGSNSGPYEVSFASVGTKTISLSIEDNGCTSVIESKTIQIDEELQTPVISCTPGIDEVIFELSADPNVLNYSVQFFGGQSATLSGTTYTVSGLLPGEEVTIEVEGISANSCPSTGIVTESCTALDCPSLVLGIDPISDPICEGDSTIIQLNVTNNSPTPNGNYTWSGTNVSADGMFNSVGLPAGEYTVEVVYDEMNCTYQSSQIIRIESLPEINATINSPIWFFGGTGRIELDVSNGSPPYTISNGPVVYSTNSVLDSIPPGEYCVSANSPFGCFAQECFTLSEGIYSIKPIHVICAGDRQRLTVLPGAGATFNWSPSFRLTCDDCSNPIANPNRTTIYTVTATLPDGRSASQNVVVVVLPSFICNGLKNDDDKDFAKLLSDFDFQTLEEKDLVEIDKRVSAFFLEKEVQIAPNPTNGKVNILTPEKVESVEVFDFSGKKVMTAFEKEIDLSKLAKGVYFFKIKIENQVVVRRVVLL